MKKSTGVKVITTIAGTSMLLGAGAAFVPAAAPVQDGQDVSADAQDTSNLGVLVSSAVSDVVKVANVQGVFSFDQNVTTPNEKIKDVFGVVAAMFCSSPAEETQSADIDEWTLKVSGDDGASVSATVGELAKGGTETKIVGCACSANLSGGGAITNAEVTGIPLSGIISGAGM